MNRLQRHLGRELSLLWLYEIEVGIVPVDEALMSVPESIKGIQEEGLDFALQLVHGVLEERKSIDQTITKYSRGWSITRLAAIERNVLRIALYELLHQPDIPTSVSVNEAVDIAKRYGTEDSGKFVNGILGAYIRGELEPPATA